MVASAPAISSSMSYGGAALVTIKFDRSDVDYQQILYTALNQALQSRPGASVQLAQTDARRHAQDVLRTMTDMGVPATRLAVSSSTDPGLANSEVRLFV